ncbi:hypothetical protein [Longirhabdus pacifica]|uniref:hypothetical protein n=1 Tax=Longirhabdus pacifica TaxID=2305227 RepID=UPI001008F02C|nr:hypothetical protein [Longirhabdus pacifica]
MNTTQVNPDVMVHVIDKLDRCLKPQGVHYVIGGSSSLMLQHVELNQHPNDVDVYVAESDVLKAHDALKSYAIDTPRIIENGMFRSNMSGYVIHNMLVELVGGFQITTSATKFALIIDRDHPYHVSEVYVLGKRIAITSLAYEFVFNVIRERADRYIPIVQKMNKQMELHHDDLQRMLQHHIISMEHKNKISQLIHTHTSLS